jgi:hypothetical protein
MDPKQPKKMIEHDGPDVSTYALMDGVPNSNGFKRNPIRLNLVTRACEDYDPDTTSTWWVHHSEQPQESNGQFSPETRHYLLFRTEIFLFRTGPDGSALEEWADGFNAEGFQPGAPVC